LSLEEGWSLKRSEIRIRCPFCGVEIPPSDRCPVCGNSLVLGEHYVRCPKCGRMTYLANFCIHCGGSLHLYLMPIRLKTLANLLEYVPSDRLDEIKALINNELEEAIRQENLLEESIKRINAELEDMLTHPVEGLKGLGDYLKKIDRLRMEKTTLEQVMSELRKAIEEVRKLLAQ